MKLDIKSAMAIIKEDLETNWSKLHFEYSIENDRFVAENEITINSLGCNVSILFSVYSSGTVIFNAVFDKIEKTHKTLELVNDYNEGHLYFKAYIDDFLNLEQSLVCNDIKLLQNYPTQILEKLLDTVKGEEIRRLVSFTY